MVSIEISFSFSSLSQFCELVIHLTPSADFELVSGSKEYEEFLQLLGDKVALKGWIAFNGGLDTKSTFVPLLSNLNNVQRMQPVHTASTRDMLD